MLLSRTFLGLAVQRDVTSVQRVCDVSLPLSLTILFFGTLRPRVKVVAISRNTTNLHTEVISFLHLLVSSLPKTGRK